MDTEIQDLLVKEVKRTLKLANEPLPSDANLIEYGLHSMAIIQLVDFLEGSLGVAVDYADFAADPSIESWLNSIKIARQTNAATNAESTKYLPSELPLSPTQYTYWAGEKTTGVPAHFYLELDGCNLDVERLASTLRRAAEKHDMLRMSVDDNGQQKIQPSITRPILQIDDFSSQPHDWIDKKLNSKRQRYAHPKADDYQQSPVRFSLTQLPDEQHRLHIDCKMLALDPSSTLDLLADISSIYSDLQDDISPAQNFFSYLEKAAPQSHPQYQASQEWWQKRLGTLPPAPLEHVAKVSQWENVGNTSSKHRLLDSELTEQIYTASNKTGITISTLCLFAFSLTIFKWNLQKKFRLNLPFFENRIDEQAASSPLGDYSDFLILDVNLIKNKTIMENLQLFNQHCERLNLNRYYPGISVLRDLAKHTSNNEIAPVVFTDGIGYGEVVSSETEQVLGTPVYASSQGPMVCLDAQIAIRKSRLLINWDYREAAFGPQFISEMFEDYISAIHAIPSFLSQDIDCETWLESFLGSTIPQNDVQVQTQANNDITKSLSQHQPVHTVVQYLMAHIIGCSISDCELDDDFFDIGGDSLLATHLNSNINAYFKEAELSVVDIFTDRSPRLIGDRIASVLPDTANSISSLFLKMLEAKNV